MSVPRVGSAEAPRIEDGRRLSRQEVQVGGSGVCGGLGVDPECLAREEGGKVVGGMPSAPADLPGGKKLGSGGGDIGLV